MGIQSESGSLEKEGRKEGRKKVRSSPSEIVHFQFSVETKVKEISPTAPHKMTPTKLYFFSSCG